MQILYDSNHWVAVACVRDEIYVADSLGKENISAVVAKQLQQLYASHLSSDDVMEVNLVTCVQQPNNFRLWCVGHSFPV